MKINMIGNTSHEGIIKYQIPEYRYSMEGIIPEEGIIPIPEKFKSMLDRREIILIPSGIFLGAMNMANRAFAQSGGINLSDRLTPLIQLIQDMALPVGICYASWGLVEIMIGNVPSGKEKIKYSVIGFIGMFIIPFVFYAVKGAFQDMASAGIIGGGMIG